MASSDVDICNSALIHLGAGFITSLNDNSDEARACKQFYGNARDAALIQADWDFATYQSDLSKLTSPPLFGWGFEYILPTFPYCLKPLFIENPEEDTAWRVHQRKLVTDRDGVKLEFIGRNTDVSQYSPLFEEYLAFFLAGKMGYTITGSRAVAQDMYALAADMLEDAASVNAQSGTTDEFGANIDQVRR